jgi:hypothetical protein
MKIGHLMNIFKTTVALTSILALSSCGVAEAIEGAIQDEVEARATARVAVATTEAASSTALVEKTDSEDDDSDNTDGDGAVDVSGFTDFEDFDDKGEAYQAGITGLYEAINGLSSVAYTDPSTLPTAGGATYDGVMSLDTLIGVMTMTADFDDDSIGGSVTDFIDDEDNEILGTLNIDSGAGGINNSADTSSEYTFYADLTGDLSFEDDAVTVDGAILGDFTGSEYEFVEGSVIGTATDTNTDEISVFTGHFVGAQD